MATKQVIKPAELTKRDGLHRDHLNTLIRYLGRLEKVDDRLAARPGTCGACPAGRRGSSPS